MKVFLTIVLVLSGLFFVGSVILQNPKGGLGFAVGGIGHANEYGSKKSLETTFKKIAMVSGVIFVFVAFVFPFALASS